MQRALRLGRVVRTEGATRDIVQARIQAKKRQLDIAVMQVQVVLCCFCLLKLPLVCHS